jgi:uncharacterized protein YbjT (DUF2867 family)
MTRILLAGSTGVVGRRLVPLLVGAGHHVTALAPTQPVCADAPGLGPRTPLTGGLGRHGVHEDAFGGPVAHGCGWVA